MNSDGASPSWYTGVEPYPGPSAYPKPSSQASKSAEKPTVDRPSVPKSLSSTSSKSSAQYVARTSVNNVQKPDTDFDENDPSCACGAGSLLGVFRGVSGKRHPVIIRTYLNFVSVLYCLFGTVRQSVVHYMLKFFSITLGQLITNIPVTQNY